MDACVFIRAAGADDAAPTCETRGALISPAAAGSPRLPLKSFGWEHLGRGACVSHPLCDAQKTTSMASRASRASRDSAQQAEWIGLSAGRNPSCRRSRARFRGEQVMMAQHLSHRETMLGQMGYSTVRRATTMPRSGFLQSIRAHAHWVGDPQLGRGEGGKDARQRSTRGRFVISSTSCSSALPLLPVWRTPPAPSPSNGPAW